MGKYRLIDKLGNTIFESNSFGGFILMLIISSIGACIAIAILGAIVCGLCNLFS